MTLHLYYNSYPDKKPTDPKWIVWSEKLGELYFEKVNVCAEGFTNCVPKVKGQGDRYVIEFQNATLSIDDVEATILC